MLNLFDAWRARTSGALDASAEAASRVWKTAAAQRRLPVGGGDRRRRLLGAADPLEPAASDRSATHLSDVPLVLNSFTKSYILDRAARAALAIDGVSGVVVNIGGDLVVRGDWTEAVAVANPANDAENSEPLAQPRRPRSRRGDERQLPARGRDRRPSLLAHHRPANRPARGTHRERHRRRRPMRRPRERWRPRSRCSGRTRAGRSPRTMPGVEYLLVERDGGRIQSAAWHTLESKPSAADPA